MRPIRVAAVFAGLALGGALFGALTGAVVAAVLVGVAGGPGGLGDLGEGYVIAAGIGAACGSLLAPIASFAFMRRVPLWRLYVETAVGTTIAGLLALSLHLGMTGVLAVAASGFLTAGARLAWVYRDIRQGVDVPPTA